MFYDTELDFLCDTLKKYRVGASVISPDSLISAVIDKGLREVLNDPFGNGQSIRQYVEVIEAHTLHKMTDEFKLCFAYLLLPSVNENAKLLFVGPFVSSHFSPGELLELGERIGISPKSQRYLEEYYSSIPVVPDGNFMFAMLSTFCEHIWGNSTFSVLEFNRRHKITEISITDTARGENVDDVLVSMKTMEKRYEFENELMKAVSLGQIQKEMLFTTAFPENAFEKRSSDPVRNSKNYSIIMNTLLRKAAEKGGVHPIYIDKLSSRFALEIEQITSLSDTASLMRNMFRSYCRLVRRHSMQTYSPVVQKAILVIDTDLSVDLSLGILAKQQGISAGYLSTVFKKETGKTVSEYIREKRIKHAAHLLATTHLQVQTVALHCGIMDVQYFSKMFKKQIGKTPKEYREEIKKA